MDALECLMTRRTAAGLVEPGPTADQIATMLAAATTAPDHKTLRPWRFVVVQGEHRMVLATAVEKAAIAVGGLAEPVVRKAAGKATRSPALIAVVVSRVPGSKVPRAEQDAFAAPAAQNICLAAHALGLGSAWKSVPMSDSDEVRAAFGMTGGEDLVGWVELGQASTARPLPPRPAVPLSSVATELTDRGLVPVSDETTGNLVEPLR